ncbi:uncharacterized protein CBL_11107 [Carabus blaptoides fortunei]
MSENCLFCKIVNHTHEADILYEDEDLIIFNDIKPAAKFHILVVPKNHLKDAKSLKPENKELVVKMIEAGKRLVEEKDLDATDTISGFHWPPFNSIQHLHLHFINSTSDMNFISRLIFKPNTWWFVTSDYTLDKLSLPEQNSHL